MINKAAIPLGLLLLIFLCHQNTVFAADFYCEVMNIEGSATRTNETAQQEPLQEGDRLQPGDVIEVFEDSIIDLAYDKRWENVTRIGPHAKVTIQSLNPTHLSMKYGKIFAQLNALPKDETFEIKTPLAIAAVRGSAYEVTHAGGQTTVTNHSDSPVTVYFLDENGNITGSTTLQAGESFNLEGFYPEERFLVLPEGTPPDLERYTDGKVTDPPVEPCFPNCPQPATDRGSEGQGGE